MDQSIRWRAAEYALEIAKSFNSQLFAVTVTSVPESYRLRQKDVVGESREMADSRAWLENFSHKAKTDNIELKTEQGEGQALRKLLLGSVASSVVSYAHCPVMIAT